MALTIPCPHCGKPLKLRDDLQGKTIRCASCQKTFKAPAAAPSEELAEVMPADTSTAPPVLEVLSANVGKKSGKPPTAKTGWGAGVLVGILAAVLVLCGGAGTLAFFVGKAIVNAVSKPVIHNPEIANSPAPPRPNPNPQPNPQPKPQPNPNPKIDPPPNRVVTPKMEQLKRVGDRLTIDARGTQMVRSVGQHLAVVGEDGGVKLLKLPQFGKDPMTYEVERTFPAVEGPIRDLAFHPSSQMALVASDHVYVYNSYTKKLDAKLTYQAPIAAVFAPAGTRLAIAVRKPGDQGSEIHLWDTGRKRNTRTPLKLSGKVHSMAWPSGLYNLAVAVDGDVHLYHTPYEDWRYQHTFAAGQGTILGMAFQQSGQQLATIGSDKTIKLWVAKDGKLLRTYEGATNPIGRPAFTPDGSRLAVLGGPGDGKVHLWHTATGKYQGILDLTPDEGGNLDFLRDNRTLVIALRKQSIRFWSILDLEGSGQPMPSGKPKPEPGK